MNTKLSLSYGTGLIQTITKKIVPEIGNKTHIDLLKIKVINSERDFEIEAHQRLRNYEQLEKCSCGYTHTFCECQKTCCLCGEDINKPTNLIYFREYERAL